MSFKNPKYSLPSFAFVIENASRPEEYRDRLRRVPIFNPAPPVTWVNESPGQRSRIIIGAWRPPQLDLPTTWMQILARLRPLDWNALRRGLRETVSVEEDDDSASDSSEGTTASVTAIMGDLQEIGFENFDAIQEQEEDEPMTPSQASSQVLPREDTEPQPDTSVESSTASK